MLNLILLYIAAIFCVCCGSFQIRFMGNKCLGMQTLYDRMLVNILKCHILWVLAFTFMCSLETFVPQKQSEIFDYLLSYLVIVLSVNDGLSLTAVAVIRYLLVFHGELFCRIQDDKVMKIVRITNILFSIYLVCYEFTVNQDVVSHYISGEVSLITY